MAVFRKRQNFSVRTVYGMFCLCNFKKKILIFHFSPFYRKNPFTAFRWHCAFWLSVKGPIIFTAFLLHFYLFSCFFCCCFELLLDCLIVIRFYNICYKALPHVFVDLSHYILCSHGVHIIRQHTPLIAVGL